MLTEQEVVLAELGLSIDEFVALAMKEVQNTRAASTAALEIVDWQERQRYKGKNPPWIKVYGREVLDSYRFTKLSAKRRLIVILLGVVATECDRDNEIPLDLKWLGKRLSLKILYADLEAILASRLVQIRPRIGPDAPEVLPGQVPDTNSLRTASEPPIRRHQRVSGEKKFPPSVSGSEYAVSVGGTEERGGVPVDASEIPGL